MKKVFVLLTYLASALAVLHAQSVIPEKLLQKSIEAMGGERLLGSITSLQYTARGHEEIIEQSERQEAPYQVSYFNLQVEKNLSLEKCLYTITYTANLRPFKIIVDGKKVGAIAGKNYFPMYPENDEQIDLAPERILFTALKSHPAYVGDSVIQGIRHRIISFRWQNNPVRLFINHYTSLPTAVEVTRFYVSNFNHVWGDTKRLTLYSLWHLEANGLHYPYQSDVLVNQSPFRSTTIDSVRFNLHLSVDTLSFPDSAFTKMQVLQKTIDPLQQPKLNSIEILPGIFQIPGNWNTGFAVTNQGIVVLDAPVSSVYSQEVLKLIMEKFPDKKIDALVSTSNAWPHIGGIRTYAARQIPIYALTLNKEIVKKMLSTDYVTYPDELAEKKTKAHTSYISKRTVIGSGPDKLELIPMFTESGERMMLIYFPSRKLLYTSDMIQPSSKGGFFMKQYLSEVHEVIQRENLEVEQVFGMHLKLTSFDKILQALK